MSRRPYFDEVENNSAKHKISFKKLYIIFSTSILILLIAFVAWAAATYGDFDNIGETLEQENKILSQTVLEMQDQIKDLEVQVNEKDKKVKALEGEIDALLPKADGDGL